LPPKNQFFDTPQKFEGKFLKFLNFTTLEQTDIRNSLLMFAQTNSNPEMLKGLIDFIKSCTFNENDKKQLLEKLFEKVFKHVKE